MDVSELPEYIRSIKDLQARYRDQIDIYIGLEIENYQAFQARAACIPGDV